jgi:hypothetical protein
MILTPKEVIKVVTLVYYNYSFGSIETTKILPKLVT